MDTKLITADEWTTLVNSYSPMQNNGNVMDTLQSHLFSASAINNSDDDQYKDLCMGIHLYPSSVVRVIARELYIHLSRHNGGKLGRDMLLIERDETEEAWLQLLAGSGRCTRSLVVESHRLGKGRALHGRHSDWDKTSDVSFFKPKHIESIYEKKQRILKQFF